MRNNASTVVSQIERVRTSSALISNLRRGSVVNLLNQILIFTMVDLRPHIGSYQVSDSLF